MFPPTSLIHTLLKERDWYAVVVWLLASASSVTFLHTGIMKAPMQPCFFPKLCCCLSLYWEKLFSAPFFFWRFIRCHMPKRRMLQGYSKLLLAFLVGHEALNKGKYIRIPYQNLLVCYGKSIESVRICKVISISWHLRNNKSCTYFRSFWLQDANPHVFLLNKSNCCH